MKRAATVVLLSLLASNAFAEAPSFREFIHDIGVQLRIEQIGDRGDPYRYIASLRHPTKGIMVKDRPSSGIYHSATGYASTKSNALHNLITTLTTHGVMQIVPWDGDPDRSRVTHHVPSEFRRVNNSRAKTRTR